ncbi:MAG: TonB-dependent receptor [Chitinispirillia bacterium]
MPISCFLILILYFCLGYSEEKQTEKLDTVQSADSIDSVSINEVEDESLPSIEKMPELIEFVEAEYPEELNKQGIEGTVLMELIVNDSGIVDSVYMLKGVHPTLDSNAVKAAKKFIFSPAIAGGEPVPVLIQYEYHFTLRDIAEKVEEYVNFSGQILEGGTKRPLADVMVVIEFIDTVSDTTLPVPFSVYREKLGTFKNQYLEEDRLVTTTDSLGKFNFYSLPACTINVAVPVPGYNRFEEREIISSGEETQVKYYVKRVRYSDYEIVVYGKVEKKEVSKRQLTLSEVKKIPGLGGDAVKVVQALPGVGRPTFGSGQVIVRGAPTWDSKFYLDGVIIPQLYHYGGIKSTYPSDALESVDFYPGGFGARYGGAIAGVIEITSRKPRTDRWQGQADLSFQDGFFLLEGPVNKNISILASARRSFHGEVLRFFIENSDLNLPYTTSPFYWDYVGRIDVEINKKNHAYAAAFGSRDKMELIYEGMEQGASDELGEETDRFKSQTTFHMGIAGWKSDISEKLSNSLHYAFTGLNSYTSVFGFAKWENRAKMHHIREQLTYKPNDKMTVNFGVDSYFFPLDLILLFPNTKAVGGFEKDTSENWLLGDIGAYVNFEIRPNENLLIIPSLRYDYYPELIHDGGVVPEFWDYKDFDNERGISGDPSFRVNGRFKFTPGHTAKFAIGTYNQTPQPMGQVIHPTWGDPQLPSTKASHFVLGYEWQITDLIHVDLQGYINRQWDIPRTAEETDADLDRLWYSDGKARMRGLELMLRHDQGERFFGWISYSFSRSERWDFKENRFVLFNDDTPNHFQFVGSLKLGGNWEMGTRIRYVTGKPETPIIGAEYIENGGGRYIPVEGKRNSVRVSPFFQIDYRIDKKIIFDKWIFSFYLDIQNLSYWLYKSPEMYIYSYDYSEKQTIISGIFFPALGFKAEF